MEETGVTLTLPRIMAPRMRMTLILITCFVRDYQLIYAALGPIPVSCVYVLCIVCKIVIVMTTGISEKKLLT